MKRIKSLVVFPFLASLLLWGCGGTIEPMPRPKGWPRMDLPLHAYQPYSPTHGGFSMEIPKIGAVESEVADSGWVDIFFKDFDCRWHLTYRNLAKSKISRDQQSEEYRALVFKHIQKVNIQQKALKAANGWGTMYELYGTVGVPAQVIYGDSSHLLMASFYFDTAVRSDSLEPVINFMKEDLIHAMETIQWK